MNLSITGTVILVLLFSCFLELLQLIKFVSILGLQDLPLVSVVLGNHFDWNDIFLYTAGAVVILGTEYWRQRLPRKTT